MKQVNYVLSEQEVGEIMSKLNLIEEYTNKITKENNIGDDVGYDEDVAEILWKIKELRRYFQ